MDALGLLVICCMKLYDYLWNVNIYDLAISYLRKCFSLINLFIVTLKNGSLCVCHMCVGAFRPKRGHWIPWIWMELQAVVSLPVWMSFVRATSTQSLSLIMHIFVLLPPLTGSLPLPHVICI